MSPQLAFAPASTFTPGRRQPTRTAISRHVASHIPTMAASNNLKRTQEIEKLQRQLAELRAQRELLTRKSSTQAQSAPAPKAVPKAPPVQTPAAGNNGSASTFSAGKHGSESRFLSISKVEVDEYFPRILTIAGRLPHLKVKDYLKTPPVLQNHSPDAGNMFVTMLPEGYNGQIIALPGIEAIGVCKDPVAVLADPNVLSATQLPVAEDDDIVLVVERNLDGIEFENNIFYLWQVGDEVQVGWSKTEPEPGTAKMIGKVIYGMIEVRKDLREKKSCWEEENETYAA